MCLVYLFGYRIFFGVWKHLTNTISNLTRGRRRRVSFLLEFANCKDRRGELMSNILAICINFIDFEIVLVNCHNIFFLLLKMWDRQGGL